MHEQRTMVDTVLLDNEAISECPVHGELIDNLNPGAVEDAIAEGVKMIEAGEMDGDAQGWERLVHARMNDTPDECPHCPDPNKD